MDLTERLARAWCEASDVAPEYWWHPEAMKHTKTFEAMATVIIEAMADRQDEIRRLGMGYPSTKQGKINA